MDVPQLLGYRSFEHSGVGKPLQYPVILLRGLGRSSGFWLEFTDTLSRHGKIVTIDLLGTGLSPSRFGRGSIEALARDVAHTLRERGLLPCHLLGISLGGMVALETAGNLGATLGNPRSLANNIASLAVLASSARCTGERRIHPRAVAILLRALRNRVPRNAEFAHFLVASQTLSARPELPLVWDEIWKREGFERVAVVRQLLAAALFDGAGTLSAIERPTLFMVSKDDGLVDWQNSPRLWERVPQAELRVLQGAGHDFPTDCPDDTARELVSFLSRVER